MGNLMNKLINVQGTTDVSNQQQTGIDTVERLVDEHRHHYKSLDIERVGNSSSSALQLRYVTIYEHLESELNELKRIHDSYNKKLLLRGNRIKRLTIEINKLKDENIALRAARNDESQSRIDDSVLQLNNSNENDLSEDCLLKIFSYLSLEDMMQVEEVCEKWYQVSGQWFKQVQTLEYHEMQYSATIRLLGKYDKLKIYENTSINSFDDLILILHSYGHHIKYYRVKTWSMNRSRPNIKECDKFLFQWVPKLCKNIVDIQINGDTFMGTPFIHFEVMAIYWKKLVKLEIGWNLLIPIEDDFVKLLRNNEQLKTFKCIVNFPTDGADGLNSDNFFTYLLTTIEKICVSNTPYNNKKVEQWSHFISASKNFTSLQSLEFSYFRYLSHAMVAAIANIQSLTHLNLNRNSYESPRTVELIVNLKGLKSLQLKCNEDLHEDSFINIVESCIQLEWLSMAYDSPLVPNRTCLTDKGMDAIAKLKRLKGLTITATHVTIGSIIKLCDRLEVLRCHDWRFNNSDIIKLLRKAMNLRLMDVSDNVNLTKDILQAANKIANDRKNKILCIIGFNDIFPEIPKDIKIDTPYFKYFEMITCAPLEIFPNDIINFIER